MDRLGSSKAKGVSTKSAGIVPSRPKVVYGDKVMRGFAVRGSQSSRAARPAPRG